MLIRLGKFEEADFVFNNSKVLLLSKEKALLMQSKLFSSQQKYKNCLEILIDHFDLFERNDWACTELLILFLEAIRVVID
ncbi:MAG: hypothetical protein PUB18_00625 [bacterium]|nr:hypothetical protein [bacterium]